MRKNFFALILGVSVYIFMSCYSFAFIRGFGSFDIIIFKQAGSFGFLQDFLNWRQKKATYSFLQESRLLSEKESVDKEKIQTTRHSPYLWLTRRNEIHRWQTRQLIGSRKFLFNYRIANKIKASQSKSSTIVIGWGVKGLKGNSLQRCKNNFILYLSIIWKNNRMTNWKERNYFL